MTRFTKAAAAALALTALGAFLRFNDIDLRPFHHDEGVNGFFLTRLVREGAYAYDPSNYHGPSLYYLSLPLVGLFGLSDLAVRGTVAAFGVLTLGLLYLFLAPLGEAFALGAVALFAVSPGAVFFSRYYIHETLFVFFTLAALACAPRRGAEAPWRFIATGLALGFLFATKETAFVSVGAIVAGAFVAAFLVEGLSPLAVLRGVNPYLKKHAEGLMNGALAFAASAGLLYSSFFRNPKGVVDAFRAFAFWTKTAVRDHDNPWNQHILWMWEADRTLLVLGTLGVVLALARRRSFLAVMGAVWTILIVGSYSSIHYKTPWLVLNMLLPLALMSGYLLHELSLLDFGAAAWGRAAAALAFALTAVTGVYSLNESRVLETERYDDEAHAYLYAHTQRSFLPLVREIETAAARLGPGKDASIAIFAPENWPLPWYLRDYKKAGYWGDFKEGVESDLYVSSVEQDEKMRAKLGDRFERIGPFNMRGVVNLVLWAPRR